MFKFTSEEWRPSHMIVQQTVMDEEFKVDYEPQADWRVMDKLSTDGHFFFILIQSKFY